MAKETKRSFVLYYDYRQHLTLLNDEERGQLLMALFDYVETGKEPEIQGAALMAFSFIRLQIDKDAAKYAETCRKRSEAGKRGGRPSKAEDENENQAEAKKANAFSEKQTEAKKADNDNENDNENDNDHYHDINNPPIPPQGGKRSGKPVDAQESRFVIFWDHYPKKVGKQAARRAWDKIKPDSALFDRIVQAVIAAKKSKEWTKEGGSYIPHPTTWLNQGRWDDELTPTTDTDKQKGAQRHGEYSGYTGGPAYREAPASETTLSGFQMAGE